VTAVADGQALDRQRDEERAPPVEHPVGARQRVPQRMHRPPREPHLQAHHPHEQPEADDGRDDPARLEPLGVLDPAHELAVGLVGLPVWILDHARGSRPVVVGDGQVDGPCGDDADHQGRGHDAEGALQVASGILHELQALDLMGEGDGTHPASQREEHTADGQRPDHALTDLAATDDAERVAHPDHRPQPFDLVVRHAQLGAQPPADQCQQVVGAPVQYGVAEQHPAARARATRPGAPAQEHHYREASHDQDHGRTVRQRLLGISLAPAREDAPERVRHVRAPDPEGEREDTDVAAQ